MPTRVTIDIFSGRPNPTVVLDGLEERELLARMAPAQRRGRGASSPARLPPGTLGYRGILVERVEETRVRGKRARAARGRGGAQTAVRIAGGEVYGPRGSAPARDPFVEDFICGSTGPLRSLGLPRSFFEICPPQIERFRELLHDWPWKPIPWPPLSTCACAPLWEPTWWNDAGKIQGNNNCYNYATNYRTDTFAQPGKANGAMYHAITCPEVKAGAIADALTVAPNTNACPKEGHLVALVVAPGWDFHWYRKGRNGKWTHKPGSTQATNLDNSGHLISDPRTADRGPYTEFCCFMIAMHGHVKIQ